VTPPGKESTAVFYRLRREFRKHFPYDGELYRKLSPRNDIAYTFIDLHGRRQSIDTTRFDRVEAMEAPTNG
jgi:hypothetical protein